MKAIAAGWTLGEWLECQRFTLAEDVLWLLGAVASFAVAVALAQCLLRRK